LPARAEALGLRAWNGAPQRAQSRALRSAARVRFVAIDSRPCSTRPHPSPQQRVRALVVVNGLLQIVQALGIGLRTDLAREWRPSAR
jgi:hypothetical protein